MADKMVKLMSKRVGAGGLRCSCCRPNSRIYRKKVTRAARREMKLADRRLPRSIE